MSLGAALRSILLSDPAVHGTLAGERIYPSMIPEADTRPAMTYEIRGPRPLTLLGTQPGAPVESTVQLVAWDTNYEAARTLLAAATEQLRRSVNRLSEGVTVTGVVPVDAQDQFEPPIEGDEIGLHPVVAQFTVYHAA